VKYCVLVVAIKAVFQKIFTRFRNLQQYNSKLSLLFYKVKSPKTFKIIKIAKNVVKIQNGNLKPLKI